MQTIDKIFKKKAVCNVQLPIFIRESDFSLEKAHVSGFAPETIAIKNEEKIILRPTSEVSFSLLFKDIVTSYKQLPLIYNQWCSVYRNEKNTKAFLRGAEFH
jgi:prolyl-tRNA synthetase